MGFAVHYAIALGTVALMLVGLQAVARAYARRRPRSSTGDRNITILESAALSQHATLHIVSVQNRKFLLASGAAGVRFLAELPEEARSS